MINVEQFKKYKHFCKECRDAHEGFSDGKLELLVKGSIRQKGFTPWASWESESTSFGKAFRFWTKYPKFLPLFICSDHGVGPGSMCWAHEIKSPFKTFFTWNVKKSQTMTNLHEKRGFHVPHPWPHYRRIEWGEPPKDRKGTLVFFPHSNSAAQPILDDFDKYIEQLKNLPNKYHPLTICISFHDVEAGNHKFLRKYGLPIVSAGSAHSRNFVDRFYSLIYQFQYTTSPNLGSHCYYNLEAGIPFFLFGDDPQYLMKGSTELKDGLMNISDYFADVEDETEYYQFRKSIETQLDTVSIAQKEYIYKRMGLDSKISGRKALFVLYSALLTNLHRVPKLYFKAIVNMFKR
jgi:hypothetical protein